ncbi:MAG: copper resistance protein CopC/CopD [Actinobacteria bacterium]|nr:copper resistance protein CopC/CopD [Actinomycetota bacterium]
MLSKTALGLLVGLSFVVATASPVAAHADLVSATPAPGSGLPQAPGAVVLRFNEPLNLRLSEIRVLDSTGADVAEPGTAAVTGDERAMKRKLGLLGPDKYRVEWTTVSAVDGHSLHGSYSFGIGTSTAGDETVRSGPVDSEGWLGLLGRFLALTGLSLWIGSTLLAKVAQRIDVPQQRLRLILRAGPMLAFSGVVLSVASSALVASGSLAAVGDVLFGGRSGLWRLALMSVAALAVLLGSARTGPSGFLALVAVVSEAASGHAASSSNPAAATLSFALHLGGVGVWVFAIVAAAVSSHQLRTVLREFTPYAVGAAAVVALTGSANALIELGHLSDLATTSYGRVVALKIGVFGVMAALGLTHYAMRRGSGNRATGLKFAIRSEVGAAAFALALATTLVSFPNPPGEAEATGGGDELDTLARMAGGDALSVARASGPFVVGLTIAPPKPGSIDVRIDVLGVDAGDGLRGATLTAVADNGSKLEVPLGPCGLGCFKGEGVIDSEGRWNFEVSFDSNRGPAKIQETLSLPAPDGDEELQNVIAAMEQVTSARMREELTGEVGGPQVRSEYVFEAPDKMTIAINQTRQVVIGKQRFRQSEPDAAWTEGSWPGSGFKWPKNYYRSFWRDRVAVRVLGTRMVDGRDLLEIAFLRPDLPAWFRLQVDPSQMVLKSQQMRAQGHIMDHFYRDYGESFDIRPPRE